MTNRFPQRFGHAALPCVFALLLVAVTASAAEDPSSGPPVAVFADLDGVWEGEFVGYDTMGKELYRIHVRQEYRTIDNERQAVKITDTSPDGTVVIGTGHNIARRRPDGSLELLCIVQKSNGDRVEHQGTLGRGPGGEAQLVWWSDTPERTDTFREVVRHHGDRAEYTIDGVGRYGDSVVVMAGRYERVGKAAKLPH